MAGKVAIICSGKRRNVLIESPSPGGIVEIVPMQTVFALLPLVAAFLTVPQFLPQLARTRRPAPRLGCRGRGRR
jgi:hypothetical protein